MILQLVNFGYVESMDPRAALHMGFLLGFAGKKLAEFGLGRFDQYRSGGKD